MSTADDEARVKAAKRYSASSAFPRSRYGNRANIRIDDDLLKRIVETGKRRGARSASDAVRLAAERGVEAMEEEDR